MKNTMVTGLPLVLTFIVYIGGIFFLFEKTESSPETLSAGFSNTVSSQIYFETQYRRGKEYGVWYAKDAAGNITALQVLPLDR